MNDNPTVVIGAGPYGLSVAAHLKAAGLSTLIFGKPMEFWENMPPTMYLKSSWSGLSFSDPGGKHNLNCFSKASGISRQEPIPLQVFLKYGHWFQQCVVPDIDQAYVQLLAQDGKMFHLDLADGRSIKAGRVVVAAGISSYANIPEYAAHLSSRVVSHSQDHRDFAPFKDKKVIVVGSGQSALESAALLYEANAAVELIARESVVWIDRRLYHRTGLARRIFYPPSDVGPPGINWLVANPLIFSRFSDKVRDALHKRAVRPSGARWLRQRVEDHVVITEHTSITSVREQGQGVLIKLSDGTTREVDHIVLGTGYRVNIHQLSFIDPALLQKVQERDGSPLLNEWFESSVPCLHFVGAPAGYVFGPLCRFVVGAKASAQQIARHAEQVS